LLKELENDARIELLTQDTDKKWNQFKFDAEKHLTSLQPSIVENSTYLTNLCNSESERHLKTIIFIKDTFQTFCRYEIENITIFIQRLHHLTTLLCELFDSDFISISQLKPLSANSKIQQSILPGLITEVNPKSNVSSEHNTLNSQIKQQNIADKKNEFLVSGIDISVFTIPLYQEQIKAESDLNSNTKPKLKSVKQINSKFDKSESLTHRKDENKKSGERVIQNSKENNAKLNNKIAIDKSIDKTVHQTHLPNQMFSDNILTRKCIEQRNAINEISKNIFNKHSNLYQTNYKKQNEIEEKLWRIWENTLKKAKQTQILK